MISTPTTAYLSDVNVTAAAAFFLALIVVHAAARRRRKIHEKNRVHHSPCCAQHDLAEHTKIFEKKVIQVKEDVLVATGYALANSICIRGETGLVIIDTTESNEAAEEVLQEFRRVPSYENLPIVGIIYTHFHTDHVGGTDSYLKQAAPECQIWAHHTTRDRMLQFNLMMGPIAYKRAARQFGLFLRSPMLENCGIGPNNRIGQPGTSMSTTPPTHTYGNLDSDRYGDRTTVKRRISIAGVELDLIHAPGETEDQTVVFMPAHRILFAADNYYEAFPNLYAIRGVPHRDASTWIDSLDAMRSLEAEIMVPSHTLPVHGKEEIAIRLRNYRDGIAYVHDQTVRLALKGEHPDAIANQIHLPSSLRSLEYLKEFYGTLHWSAKAIFSGYLGWFSGEAAELIQMDPAERASHMVALGGGADKCLAAAENALRVGNDQWVLELVTALLSAPSTPLQAKWRATKLRVDVLKKIGQEQINANARNYYLTSALETNGELKLKISKSREDSEIARAPIDDLFKILQYRVDAVVAEAQSRWLGVRFSDTERIFVLVLHNSVLKLASDNQANSLLHHDMGQEWMELARGVEVTCSETAWRKMLTSPLTLGSSWFLGNFKVTQGSIVDFEGFMACIDKNI